MARVFLLAFNESDAYLLVKKLRALGHRVAVAEPKAPEFVTLLKQQVQPPDVFVGDCGRLASQTREAGNYIRGLRAHRETPFILYNVKAEDEGKCRERVPGAILLVGDDVAPAIDGALGPTARGAGSQRA